jgi:AcrR family transcriptional regulator
LYVESKKMKKKVTKGQKTKEKIIKAGIKLFAKKGYFETSFQDIANKLSYPQSTVMNHFPNRKSLFMAVREFVVMKNRENVDLQLQADLPAWNKLILYSQLNIQYYLENRNYGKVVLLFYYYAGQDKQFQKVYKEGEARAIERIQLLLSSAQREGAIDDSINISEAAEAIQHYLRGLVVREFMGGEMHWADEEKIPILEKRIKALLSTCT